MPSMLLIVDKSGSMAYDPLQTSSKIDMAKEAVRLASGALSDGDEVGILRGHAVQQDLHADEGEVHVRLGFLRQAAVGGPAGEEQHGERHQHRAAAADAEVDQRIHWPVPVALPGARPAASAVSGCAGTAWTGWPAET